MATQNSFSTLLNNLTTALNSARESSEQLNSLAPVHDGISLLDVKNEIFLSYLQNLVFLIILKLRNRKLSQDGDDNNLENSTVKKLVELQVYAEKGVRPLENRLKYQIDKVLRAADENARRAEKHIASKPHDQADESNSASDSDEDSTNDVTLNGSNIDHLQYRPNPAAFVRRAVSPEGHTKKLSDDGIYKPPRIQAISMRTTGPREKEAKKPDKSATLEEFVSTEMSAAPIAEPSIGSTIVKGGMRNKSEKERMEERERRDYEERNYVRLPKESKKERSKKNGARQDVGYGGEEWRSLGQGIDRIERMTKKRSGEGRSALDKSRKRPIEDKPRGSGGPEVGEGFQKRLKLLDGGRRDRGRR